MKFRLNREQIKKISDMASGLSLFFLGLIITPLFVEDVDRINPAVVPLGAILGILFFLESLIILRGMKDES